jgi:hypothetical protein
VNNLPAKVNPLTSFMRQPKIYIKLPSNGAYWGPGSIVLPENGELAVYSMTAKDELAFKTPDALMNGQAVVDVIQSCIPSIKDAWKIPNTDLDLILIAIRLATFGERMEVSHVVPGTGEEVTHEIDLRQMIDQLIVNGNQWQEAVTINDQLTCFVHPLTYRHITATGLKTFETQKLMQVINNDQLSEEQKLEVFNKTFKVMAEITIDLISDSIREIHTPDAVVTDRVFIREFIENTDKEVYKKLEDHISGMKNRMGLQPLTIRSTEEQIAAGAPETYKLPISMDNSNFFGAGS